MSTWKVPPCLSWLANRGLRPAMNMCCLHNLVTGDIEVVRLIERLAFGGTHDLGLLETIHQLNL